MQSVSSRIWTRVAVSVSYDDNHYTTGTSSTVIYRTDEPLIPHKYVGHKWEAVNMRNMIQ